MKLSRAEMIWLKNLKVGDCVFIYNGGSLGGDCRIENVTRLTKTQIIVGSCAKFRRHDGMSVGSIRHGHTTTWIREATPERIASTRRPRLLLRLMEVSWKDQSSETLEKVMGLVK